MYPNKTTLQPSGAQEFRPRLPLRQISLAVLAAMAATGMGRSALAAGPETGTQAAGQVEEIVVTAQKRSEKLQDTPVSITAFTTKGLEQRGVSNLQDVSNFAPNLELHATNRPAGGGSAYAAFIRGVGNGDFQFPTDPGVGLYVDDVYMARTIGGLLSIEDIERIEVLKGPQGTLYGRNAIGGAMNVITSKPSLDGEMSGSVKVRLGNYGRKDLVADVNSPLSQGTSGFKLSVADINMDGYGKQILTGAESNSEHRQILRGSFLAKASKDLSVQVDADYSRQEQKPPNGVLLNVFAAAKTARFNSLVTPSLDQTLGLPAGSVMDNRWLSSPYNNYGMSPLFDNYEASGISARINYQPANAMQIKSITAYRKLNSSIAVDGDQVPYSLQTSQTTMDQHQFSQEFQFSGEAFNNRLKYLFGVYAFEEKGNSSVTQQSFHGLWEITHTAADAADTLTDFYMKARSLALYTQETLTLAPDVNLTFGARANRDSKDYSTRVLNTELGTTIVPTSFASASWSSFTPKIGVDWKPTAAAMLYANYSKGFKSGGFGASTNPLLPTPAYNPEKLDTVELGVKSEWMNRKLTANLAAFYSKYKDIQLTVQTAAPGTGALVRTTQNGGDAQLSGLELELVAAPSDNLKLNLALGYVADKFVSLTPQALSVGIKMTDKLPQVPRMSASLGAEYLINTGYGKVTLRGDASYKGDEYLTIADPISFQNGYTLYNASISFAPTSVRGLNLTLQGTNLMDKRYYIYHANLAPTGEEVAIPAAPRMIALVGRYTF